MTKKQQLATLSEACLNSGAEVRYYPGYGHFTAIFWEDGKLDEAQAHSVQQKIQQLAAHYPGLVCYCFDAFSTLVYTI